jgi:hypothetical protein
MKGKFSLGLIAIMVIMGMALIGCDNGTTDNGTAPTLTEVIVASSSTDAVGWTSANTFTKGDIIYIGIDCADPDLDIVKFDFFVMYGGNAVATDNDVAGVIPLATYKGYFCITDTNDARWQSAPAGQYAIKITLIDAKGNRSASITSNTFTLN